MDIALAVDHLLPAADYRRCDDYATLVDTWHDARPVPTESELLAAWDAIQSATAASTARDASRSALAVKWAALPAWIQGPYGARYAEVVRMLDASDDDAAIAIVEYAAPPAGYDEEKKAVFEFVPADLLAALQRIKTH